MRTRTRRDESVSEDEQDKSSIVSLTLTHVQQFVLPRPLRNCYVLPLEEVCPQGQKSQVLALVQR